MKICGYSYEDIRNMLNSLETPEESKNREFREQANHIKWNIELNKAKYDLSWCEYMFDEQEEEEVIEFLKDAYNESSNNNETVSINDEKLDIDNKYLSTNDNKVRVGEEERIIKLLIDTKSYGRKPSKDVVEKSYIHNGIEKKIYEPGMVNIRLVNNQVSITVSQLINEIISGKSFTLAAFKNGDDGKIHRTKACWESQDLLALDFDDGITPEEFLDRSKQLKLMPTFVYTSFSDTPEQRKFRAVYVLKKRLYDYRDANTCTLALMELFKECDKACKDPSRLYYGGQRIVYEDIHQCIDPYELIDAYCYSLFLSEDNSNYKRNIRTFSSKVALNLENGLPKRNVVNVADSISIYRGSRISDKTYFDYAVSEEEVRQNCSNSKEYNKKNIRYCVKNEKVKRKVIKNIDINEVMCPFWRMFLDGNIYPFDNEFMHICLNILSIKGGEKAIRKAIDDMPMASEKIKKLYKQKVGYFKNRYLNISRCEGYCPKFNLERERVEMDGLELTKVLKAECNNEGYTMLDTIVNRRGNIRVID